jgi:phenylalanyl-tRNA synthetase beta chain
VGLLCELAGAEAAPGLASAGSALRAASPIKASAARINALLGSGHSPAVMAALLERRGFTVAVSGELFEATPPSWRPDVAIEADLAEEVAHLFGLENVQSTHLPEVRTPDADADEWANAEILRGKLAASGLREASTLSYLDPALAAAWGFDKALTINNPLSVELSLLRPSLLPNLVAAALESLKRKAPGAALFEMGRLFEGAKEQASLALAIAGQNRQGNWAAKPRDYDFYDLKGMLEGLASQLGFGLKVSAEAGAPAYLHPGQSARFHLGPMAGWMGALHPGLAKALDARHPVFVLELQGWASQALSRPRKYKAFSLLPQVERDLSCVVDSGFEAGKLLELVKKEGFAEGQVTLKDKYQGAPLPEGKKSLTLALTYLPQDKTLTDEEVNQKHAALSAKLKSSLPLEIRD